MTIVETVTQPLVQKPPKVICIYHGNCADGFGAAWVVRKWHLENEPNREIEFVAGIYQNAPPDTSGCDVVMVDFSYKREVIDEMIKTCHSLTIIDHHKSAIENLAIFNQDSPVFQNSKVEDIPEGHYKVTTLFDTEHSGAMLTWMYYFNDDIAPLLLQRIEDRDLWKFKYPDTREVQANLFSFSYVFEVWDALMKMDEQELQLFRAEGAAIERKHFKDINELLIVGRERMDICGYDIPVCNLPYTMSSDAGNIMAIGEPFSACYMVTPQGINFSLRSDKENPGSVDVSEIAKKFGGGGHKNAAGFRIKTWDEDYLADPEFYETEKAIG